jgi:hypothetical protein
MDVPALYHHTVVSAHRPVVVRGSDRYTVQQYSDSSNEPAQLVTIEQLTLKMYKQH